MSCLIPQSQLAGNGFVSSLRRISRHFRLLGHFGESSGHRLGLKTWCGFSHRNLIANKLVDAWQIFSPTSTHQPMPRNRTHRPATALIVTWALVCSSKYELVFTFDSFMKSRSSIKTLYNTGLLQGSMVITRLTSG